MASIPFIPYWRQVGEAANPYSFVFFVVAQIAGRRRPVAVVSSRASADLDGSLQGTPLVAACQRIITIFADPTNHPAVQAELVLAVSYYTRDEPLREYRPDPVELPENPDNYRQPRLETAVWDQVSVREFPFITACLLQGVAFDAHGGYCYRASPEPLGVVYRDSSVEWGMVVVDITELCKVRYGIVGFAAAPMKWASSAEAIQRQRGTGLLASWAFETGGEFRLLDEVRPRVVMSASEYLVKYPSPVIIPAHDNMIELLAPVPLVDSDALELIWPPGSDDDGASLTAGESVRIRKPLHEQAIRSLLQSTIDVANFNMAIFDDVRKVPNFQEILKRNILNKSTQLGSNSSVGQLLRLAFDDEEHLSFEHLDKISVEAISAALNVPGMRKISSISLCVDSIQNPSIKLIEELSRSENLRRMYVMRSPFRDSDILSGQLFEALSTRPQFLSRVKVMFAGSYSSALRKNFWLPTIPEKASPFANTVQVAPLSIFPIQQILVRYQINSHGSKEFKTRSVYLGDSLLGPERFAAGFLIYLRTLIPSLEDYINPAAQLFSFSSAPASLSTSPLTSAEISPIPAENFALANDSLPEDLSPKIRDLVPNGWTVLVSSEYHWDRETAGSWGCHGNPALRDRSPKSEYIRYAFIRARRQNIEVGNLPSRPSGPDDLEVVGFKEFLAITAPEVDSTPLDRRLAEVAEHLAQRPNQGILPSGLELLSVLDHVDAAGMLLGCLKDAVEMNKNLRDAMEDNPEGQQWYSELLYKKSDAK